MDTGQLNMDDFVEYEAEYKAVIKNAKIRGKQLIGRCPFHDDKKDSFSVNVKTGQWKCFAEGKKGNFTSFYAEIHGIDNKEAYKEILKKYGKFREPEERKPKNKGFKSYTLEEYAKDKHLPEEFLMDVCKVTTAKDRDGTQFLKIPYMDEEGKTSIFRKRYGDKTFRWSNKATGNLILYGEWRLPEIRQNSYAILAEGESDTQTLWHLKFSALGVPGASIFNARMVEKLQGLKIYIHVEPDKGGQTFLSKICSVLKEQQANNTVYSFSCSQFGVKDPSELYLKDGAEEAAKKIHEALEKAEKVEISDVNAVPETVKGAPVNLRQPNGWIYSDEGICYIDAKTMMPVLVCKTPVILSKRLHNIETGDEKIEVAFKRDGKWTTCIMARSTVFTTKGITVLSDLGCTVTSENARQVVRFLQALESENMDTIQKTESSSTLGWKTKGRFLPYFDGGIVLDNDPSFKIWTAACHSAGTFEKWISMVQPHRERNKFRFILAASFAAPLLRIIKQRNFMVYNWGNSKAGKTATLKAALSVWGEPEKLMADFNATQVALERMAGFFNDLPLGIDERQLAGKDQKKPETLAYMLANGTGRARGNRTGGLQALNTWHTIIISTGEEPLSTDTTQTGVSTRTFELYGGPFEDEKSASRMHQQTSMNYGWAGKRFIKYLIETDESSIIEQYEKMADEIYNLVEEEASGAHISEACVVALADAMIDTWIFKNKDVDIDNDSPKDIKKPLEIQDESYKRAICMAKDMLCELLALGTNDVNANATQFAVDWILSNRNNFEKTQAGGEVNGICYGFTKDNKVYIFPSLFKEALSRAGFNPSKTIRYLAENDIITTKKQKKGNVYNLTRYFMGRNQRFIEFDLGKFSNEEEQESKWQQVKPDEEPPFYEQQELSV